MLLTLKNASLHIGSHILLDRAEATLQAGERVCLLGRNGAGKTTLLQTLGGHRALDSGEIQCGSDLRTAELPQNVPDALPGSVYEVVAAALGETGALLAEFQRLSQAPTHDLKQLERVQLGVEARDGWTMANRVNTVITRLSLPAASAYSALSGGMKRRALLARALVTEPTLLLLDEPTNHLDLDSIEWLEEFLLTWNGTLLFVTHDRTFLRHIATRIIELDRGILRSWPGTYDDYLRRKAEALEAEATQDALFDKQLAREEAWIRKGIEARRTRNQGRVERLLRLREEDRNRRRLPGSVKLVLQEAERSGRLVIEAKDLGYHRAERAIVSRFSTLILRGDKIGIIGPNGVGKTTLLKLLLGELEPDAGSLRRGTNLQIAYFDQLRASLDEDRSVVDNIAEGKEFLDIRGQRRHVMSYLQDFLFSPERARGPLRVLSGGERSRLLLARLFAQPSNLLVLDEPTNDLDIETLDLLEEQLHEYPGTVLLVSHDRELLDRVVGRCLVFEGHARIGEYVGGYQDWLRQRAAPPAAERAPARPPPAMAAPRTPAATASKAAKLGYREQRELADLPDRIGQLEAEQQELTTRLSDPEFYRRDHTRALQAQQRLSALEGELAEAYARWEVLEARR